MKLGVGLALLASVSTQVAFAQEADYLKNLELVGKKVRDQRAREVTNARLGNVMAPVAALKLSRRPYRVGESWKVAFLPSLVASQSVVKRARLEASDDAQSERAPTFFDFKVLEVKNSGDARIKVSQSGGDQPADYQVDYLVVTLNPRLVLTQKEVYYRDGRAPVVFGMNDRFNRSIGFDVFPIDLPNLTTESGAHPSVLPELPASIVKALKKALVINREQALEFQAEDLYARPVHAIWREKDLWPVYMNTSSGTAVLVD